MPVLKETPLHGHFEAVQDVPQQSRNLPSDSLDDFVAQNYVPGDPREHPGVPHLQSTKPLALRLRVASPLGRQMGMTVTGAPSGFVPVAQHKIHHTQDGYWLEATRASYQQDNRQAVDKVITEHLHNIPSFPSVGKGGLPLRSPRHSRKDMAAERASLFHNRERHYA